MKKLASILLSALMVLSLCACSGQKEAAPTWQEQYDLGVKYLSEGNYEEAIIAFAAAIEIEPKRVDAYLGRAEAYMSSETIEDSLTFALSDYETALALDDTLADAYLGMAEIYIVRGEYDKAEDVLRTGIEKTGDGRLSARLKEIADGNVLDYWGRTTREVGYDGSGVLLYRFEYTYLTGGQSWRYDTAASYDGNGNQTGYVKYEYDEAGRAVRQHSENYTGDGGYIAPVVCTYDADGNEIRCDWYDVDGDLLEYSLYEYNGKGWPVRECIYEPDGRLRQEFVKEFSAEGTLSKETYLYYYEDGRYSYEVTEYDETGRPIRHTSYDTDGEMSSYTTHEYDENGNNTAWRTYDRGGTLSGYSILHYDEEGNLLERDDYDGKGNLTGSVVFE